MMGKSVRAYVAILALCAVHVSGHAAISPALGIQGTPSRNDVQRPGGNNPCGNVDIAGAIDNSTPVTADASGAFSASIENFNGGRDGSRQVTMSVNADGTGGNFVNGQVTANGEAEPAGTGTEQISASLPAGTTCTGGASGNLCLASFTTLGGFGNCVVVQQGAGNGGNAGNAGNGNNNGGNNNGNGNNAGNNGNGANGNGANGNGNNGNGNNGNGNNGGNNGGNGNGNGNGNNNANGNNAGNNAGNNGNGANGNGANGNGANGNGNNGNANNGNANNGNGNNGGNNGGNGNGNNGGNNANANANNGNGGNGNRNGRFRGFRGLRERRMRI